MSHRTGFIKATALREWQQGGCSGFVFFSGIQDGTGVKAWGSNNEQEDKRGLIVYGKYGKKCC